MQFALGFVWVVAWRFDLEKQDSAARQKQNQIREPFPQSPPDRLCDLALNRLAAGLDLVLAVLDNDARNDCVDEVDDGLLDGAFDIALSAASSRFVALWIVWKTYQPHSPSCASHLDPAG